MRTRFYLETGLRVHAFGYRVPVVSVCDRVTGELAPFPVGSPWALRAIVRLEAGVMARNDLAWVSR